MIPLEISSFIRLTTVLEHKRIHLYLIEQDLLHFALEIDVKGVEHVRHDRLIYFSGLLAGGQIATEHENFKHNIHT